MVPLTTEERAVGTSRRHEHHTTDALTDIDSQLRQSDPDFHAWVTRGQFLLRPRTSATVAGALVAITGTFLLAAAVRRSLPLLVAAAITLLLAVTAHRRTIREPTEPADPSPLTRAARWLNRVATLSVTAEGLQDESIQDVAGTVVIALTDGGPADDGALRYAADEACLRRVELLVLSTYHLPIDPDLDDFDTPVAELRRQAWARAATAIGRTVPAALPRRIVVAAGSTAHVLSCRLADAVLVVVPAPRHRLLTALRLADNPTAVLGRTQLPVVVVPPNYHA
jgi:nucleotide-binding universal stress UspA family protein